MAKKTAKPITSANVAHITPSVLTWGIQRSSHSRETLAQRLGISTDELKKWERDTPPPMDKAEKLASLLGIPFGFFYLSSPPEAKVPLPDRRQLTVGYKPSQHFLELLDDVLLRRDWYRDYAIEIEQSPLPFVGSFSISAEPNKVAADIRRRLELGPKLRHSVFSWTDYGAALAKQAEANRILVMRSSVVGNDVRKAITRTEVQGFAIADGIAPIVFINSADFKAAQVFTLAHELAHIWIGDSAISNPNQGEESNVHKIERFCDRVATEVLVPEAEFRPLWRVKALKRQDVIDELAMTYWVSALVIVRRASELGLVSTDEAHYLRKRAIAAQRAKEKKGRPNYFRVATVRAGYRLTDAVRSEVEKGNLLYTHAGRLLGMKTPTLAKFIGTSRTP